jgi:hypothetical protein
MEVSTEQLPSHQFPPDFDRQLQAYNRGAYFLLNFLKNLMASKMVGNK